ncbi:hypothetical protein RJ639_042052 [Escallonia herrerae]|uniref:RRM domain-containing protein n=1 Tax=Escallonia herrerae TaxID=1293975 RepID=A0AA89B5H5_9ASTE|nr:hypothetical protein RJ639_042052 [Escallonia herrerae]
MQKWPISPPAAANALDGPMKAGLHRLKECLTILFFDLGLRLYKFEEIDLEAYQIISPTLRYVHAYAGSCVAPDVIDTDNTYDMLLAETLLWHVSANSFQFLLVLPAFRALWICFTREFVGVFTCSVSRADACCRSVMEKSTAPSGANDYLQRRDEQRSTLRGSPFSHKHSKARHPSPDSSKMGDKNAEPSEVLWIGFPALLKVDEVILRKAFSPFGEIVKISVFPGRTYAFIQFRNVMAACRAKETLQGKLFGNPRVHICFSRSEFATSNSGRNPSNAPLSPHSRSYGRPGSAENFRPDRYHGNVTGGPSIRSTHFIPNLESGDPDAMTSFNKRGNIWADGTAAFEQRRFHDLGSELEPPERMYEKHGSPQRERGASFGEYSPQQFPRQGPFYDEAWDLPEDPLIFRGAKKLKTNSFPPDNELPEYPFSDSEQVNHVLPRISDFPQHEALGRTFDSGPFGYKQIPERGMNFTQSQGERSDTWNQSYDSLHVGPVSLPSNHVERKRSTPESNEVWKWEGTIAKGGTAVCRARCFPVGKVMDMMLPPFLDCTARTGLDMLAKHYYQAASAWVVFFVPESDADIGYYNEFMNYLGEKERAAVAKLDEKTTLFLVPPSEFSEKVLKVPGKLSISGVILRLENPASSFVSHEQKDTNPMSFHGDTPYTKPSSPSGPYSSMQPFPNFAKPAVSGLSFSGNLPTPAPPPISGSAHTLRGMPDAINDSRHEQMLHQRNPALGPNWSETNHLQNSNIASQMSNSVVDPNVQGYNPLMPRTIQETSLSSYATGVSGFSSAGSNNPQVSSSLPVAALQSEQLAQLASSLLGQQRQGGVSIGEELRQSSTMSLPQNSYRTSQQYALPNNQASSDFSSSHFSQMQQQQQQLPPPPAPPANVTPVSQRELPSGTQVNQQLQNAGMQEEDADPQKRLQATLQLAAALLQQIQQGKGY